MDYYALCICISGTICVEIDNTQHTIESNSLLISAPYATVHILSFSDNFRMKLLFFAKNFLLSNISDPYIIENMSIFKNGIYSIIHTDYEKTSQILSLLDYLKKKTSEESHFKQEIIQTIIFNILLEVADITFQDQEYSRPLSIPKDTHLKFLKSVRENIRRHKSVLFYAGQMCISSKYLLEIVKKATGKTPHQIIDETIVKEAINMMNDRNLNISDIAYELNFSSVAAFSRFFKKMTQESPLQYRKKN